MNYKLLVIGFGCLTVFAIGFYSGNMYSFSDSKSVIDNSIIGGLDPQNEIINEQSLLANDKETSTEENNEIWQSKFANLNAELSSALSEIKKLQQLNSQLSGLLAGKYLPKPSSSALDELLERVDILPDQMIEGQLERLFDKKSIDKISDPKVFSKRLIEISLEAKKEDNYFQSQLMFSLSPTFGQLPLISDMPITSSDTIFAHYKSENSITDVVVKWQNMLTGEVIQLRDHSVSEDGYFWLRPQSGWSTGSYVVSIYRMEDNLEALFSDTFSVIVNDSDENELHDNKQHIINEMLLNGKAVQKQRSN